MKSINDILIEALQLQNQGNLDAAIRLFNEILTLDPNNAGALYSLSVAALNSGNSNEALQFSGRGVKAAPHFAPLHFVHGAILQVMGENEEALLIFDKALEIQPDYIEVLLNSGVLLRNMFRHKDALERFNKILSIDPNHVSALGNAGIILTEFKQSKQAIAMFERLIKINPEFNYALGLLFYERMHICDWDNYDALKNEIVDGIRAGKRTCKSLAFMCVSDEARDHLLAAKIFASHYCPKGSKTLWQGEIYRHDKIRIAYVSPDFREHPVGHLIAGVLERHDKSRFETIAISLGIDDQSRLRTRMLSAFDRFVDARNMGSEQIAQLMREMEVDIAIDLGGYTSDTRTDIFSFRPAPIQVNYLGYPGTMGTDYIDYILADRHVIPPEHQPFYSENVVYLPDSYLPTDDSVSISERTPSRHECGLPDTGIVFCSFSHDYKISPPVFEVWMRLLKQVPNSVLWLMSRGETAQHNLRKEAEARGVVSTRLVFADRVPMVEDHLARYRIADLFLDTHPYNAHTTAADALMAGLPVVTFMGGAFPSRVAGSLLHAIKVPELITHSLEDYESLARRLASSPDELGAIKQRIRDNKVHCSLFDTSGFCCNLESAYTEMWERYQNGSKPEHFFVARPHQAKVLDVESHRMKVGVKGNNIGHNFTLNQNQLLKQKKNIESAGMKIRIKGDVFIAVPDNLSLMTPYVLLEQEDWFESEIEFIRRLLKPGMKVIDVGANYGCYALTAAKIVGIQGCVLAFEPASKTAAYLKRSIELNLFVNIKLLQCALSDHAGEAMLSISENAELNTLQQTASDNSESVRLRTLDECYTESGLGSIDFFKLDAEGEEIKILVGADKFLKQQSPLIMFELKHGDNINLELINKFEQLNYKIFTLVPGLNMLAKFDPAAPLDPSGLNLFACKDDRAEILEQCDMLATSTDSEIPQHHSNKNLWATFLNDQPYGKYFLPHYNHFIESEAGDWPIYRQALNDYVSSHLTTTTGKLRVAFLARSLATLTDLLNGKVTSFSRLCTWIRVATEAGNRGIAVNISAALIKAVDTGQITIDVSEPFFPAFNRYDTLNPENDPADWCLSSVIETNVRLCHFSSYFSGTITLPLLERLTKSCYQSQEMERRRQLIRIRYGLQQAPEKCPQLQAENQHNLNNEFWMSGNFSQVPIEISTQHSPSC